MMAPTLLLAAVLQAQPSAPPRGTISGLHNRFLQTVDPAQRAAVLPQIARTPPETPQEVAALYDLFARFTDPPVRQAVMDSLRLLGPGDRHLEESFLYYLQEGQDAEAFVFGVQGSLRVRSRRALPPIRERAKRRFGARSPGDLELLTEKNEWWAQYEALAALAQWEGADALPLLKKKSRDAPQVAEILGTFLWKEALPLAADWSQGGSRDKERAGQILKARVPSEALRETRPLMLELLRDPKADGDLRHQLAIKIGATSTDAEAAGLVREHAEAADERTRLLLAAAIFASGSQAAVPLLKQYVRENPDANARMGALAQLRDMVSRSEYRALLEWVARNDANIENREDAQRDLTLPPR